MLPRGSLLPGVCIALLGACTVEPASEAAATAPPVLDVRRLDEGERIVLDGTTGDAAWTRAPELVVPLAGGGPSEVRLKAATDGRWLYLLAIWRDPEPSLERHWTYRGDATWERTLREDAFSVAWPPGSLADEFREQGCALFCHDGAHRYPHTERGLADWWVWGAQSTNTYAQADDRRLPFGENQRLRGDSQPEGSGNQPNVSAEYEGPAGVPIRVGRGYDPILEHDNAQALTRERLVTRLTASAVAGWRVPYDIQRPRAGSRADVRAAGRHAGNGWVLELARPLRTGHPDDRPLGDPLVPAGFAVAVHDAAGGAEHAVSGPLALRFPPPR